MSTNIRALVAGTLCLLGPVLVGTPACSAQAPEDAAQEVAEAWLTIVDAARYGESWDQAAALFKHAVTREQWEQAVGGVRGPLGDVVSRKIKSRQYTEQVPGAPDGKYVILQFDTVFQNKASAVETVTPLVDEDGAWRVSGYFVK